MTEIEPIDRTTILVCVTCRVATDPVDAPQAGMALADATVIASGDAADICVQRVRCLGNCGRGLTAAIRRAHAWTYVFGGLHPTRDAPTLIDGARLLASAADGVMPWRGRPEPLKRGLIARLPPIDFQDVPA